MEEITAGLLFNDTMVMIAGGDNNNPVQFTTQENVHFDVSGAPSSSSSCSSSNSPTYYPSTTLPAELFTEFNEFTAFNLSAPGLLASAENSDSERMMEELISSDLSSDEDKFLETIRCGGGNASVLYTNTLLSEEELVNTIQNYGDVKVVQVESGSVSAAIAEAVEVINPNDTRKSPCKKRKVSCGGGGAPVNNKPAKKSDKKPHKTPTESRVFDDAFVDFGSPSPGSPQQQVHENGTFQELKLSDEEKRLLMKEGITLPSHYPLTKLEERELKRIRRKIRNKISAQDSRKRKKEFLDRLQHKLQEVEDEKNVLQKRVRSLESINSKLNQQVKRLQQALTNAGSPPKPQSTTSSSIPAATTLLVLILSLALVVLPSSMEKRQQNSSPDNSVSSSEILSLLNRSNELRTSKNFDTGDLNGNTRSSTVKSRVMIDDDDEDDTNSYVNVKELITQMRSLLKTKNVGVKRKRGIGAFGNALGRSGYNNNAGANAAAGGWYESDSDESTHESAAAAAGVYRKRSKMYRTFQILDDVQVD